MPLASRFDGVVASRMKGRKTEKSIRQCEESLHSSEVHILLYFSPHRDFQGAGGGIFRGADGVEYRGVEFIPDGVTKR